MITALTIICATSGKGCFSYRKHYIVLMLINKILLLRVACCKKENHLPRQYLTLDQRNYLHWPVNSRSLPNNQARVTNNISVLYDKEQVTGLFRFNEFSESILLS